MKQKGAGVWFWTRLLCSLYSMWSGWLWGPAGWRDRYDGAWAWPKEIDRRLRSSSNREDRTETWIRIENIERFEVDLGKNSFATHCTVQKKKETETGSGVYSLKVGGWGPVFTSWVRLNTSRRSSLLWELTGVWPRRDFRQTVPLIQDVLWGIQGKSKERRWGLWYFKYIKKLGVGISLMVLDRKSVV